MERRRLQFANEREAAAEIRRLAARAYGRAGRWDLGQVCEHLCIVMRGSMDGFEWHLPWVVRRVAGPVLRRGLLRRQTMPAGFRAPARFMPHTPASDTASVPACLALLERLATHPGPWHESPLFGKMTGDDWRRVHLMHAAHHLGFLVPTAVPSSAAAAAEPQVEANGTSA